MRSDRTRLVCYMHVQCDMMLVPCSSRTRDRSHWFVGGVLSGEGEIPRNEGCRIRFGVGGWSERRRWIRLDGGSAQIG
jgi:hypothetical protein